MDAARELALIRQAQAGDAAAAGELVQGHLGVLRQITRRVVGGERMQEYMGVAVNAALACVPRFDARRGLRFMSFAGRAAQNNLVRARQQDMPQRRTCPLLDMAASEQWAGPESAPDAALIERETRALAWHLVRSLPDAQRRVVLGRIEGRTLQALGTEMGLTNERVRQIYVQAVYGMRSVARVALNETAA